MSLFGADGILNPAHDFYAAAGVIIPQKEADYFPEQMPYTEWQNSEFDDAGTNPQSCQTCQ